MAHSGTKLGIEALVRHSPTSLPGETDKRKIRERGSTQTHTFFFFFTSVLNNVQKEQKLMMTTTLLLKAEEDT